MLFQPIPAYQIAADPRFGKLDEDGFGVSVVLGV